MKSYQAKTINNKTKLPEPLLIYQDSLTFRQDELIVSLLDSIQNELSESDSQPGKSKHNISKLKSLFSQIEPGNNDGHSKSLSPNDYSLSALSLLKELFASGIAKNFLQIILTLPDGTPLSDAESRGFSQDNISYIINNLQNAVILEIFSDFFSLNPQIMNLLKDFSNLLELMPTQK